jgi:hypothetical protein
VDRGTRREPFEMDELAATIERSDDVGQVSHYV